MIIVQCLFIAKHQVIPLKYIVFICQLYLKKGGKKLSIMYIILLNIIYMPNIAFLIFFKLIYYVFQALLLPRVEKEIEAPYSN